MSRHSDHGFSDDDFKEYVVISQEDFYKVLGRSRLANDLMEISLKDAVVIQLRHAWAGPALHIVAGAVAMARRLAFDMDQATVLGKFADYFHTKAEQADAMTPEIPGE